MKKHIQFNHTQLKKTADLLLDVAKNVLLGSVIAAIIPGIGSKVTAVGFFIGFMVASVCYFSAMLLIKEVK